MTAVRRKRAPRADLEAGHAALARSDWQGARTAFRAALRACETGAAHEGLSWAAWWLDAAEETIRAREAAYRLYKQSGDTLAAGRLATWLATDHEDFRGELAIARGWRERARRLLEGLPLAPEHGWLAILEGEAAIVIENDTQKARRCAETAIAVARQCQDPDIEIMALGIEGLALVSEARVEEGMTRLDEAVAAALGGELTQEVWANKVVCNLIFACERVRDYERAAEWCEKMRDLADRMRLKFAQGFCRAHYGSVLISCGEWADAEATLAHATVLLEESRPPWAAEAVVRLAELRRRQGRFDEAAALLHRAEWYPSATLGLAEIALDTGRLRDGEELAERFLRQVRPENRMQRAPALEILVRVAALSGKPARAAEAFSELQALTDAVATPPLRAATCFSAAVMALAGGDLEPARTCLEDAVDLFERSGTPYEAARARLELAGVLAALGRLDRARDEALVARAGLEALGAKFSVRRAATVLADIDRRSRGDGAGTGSAADGLTPRQVEVLRLVSHGQSDREIAAALGVSAHTVHRHVANILMRLDAPTRAAAAAQAASRGLI